MRKPIIIKVLSGLINILVCLIIATIILYFQDWFGSGDIRSLVFWTIPLAVGLMVSGRTILTLLRVQNQFARLLLIIFIAGIISLCFVYLVYMFLGPYINSFSFPVFYIWIAGSIGQLVFLDRLLPQKPEKLNPIKVILGIAAFPLALLLTIIGIYLISFVGSNLNRPSPVTYLIPNNFQGIIRIIYGEECGINPPKESGRRVLKIPTNGLLIIQPEYKAGIIDHEYYFVDENEKREKLTPLYDKKDKSKGVRLGSVGGRPGAMPDGSFSTESPLAIRYMDLQVNNDTLEELTDMEYTLQFKQIDSLMTASIKKCREEIKKKGT